MRALYSIFFLIVSIIGFSQSDSYHIVTFKTKPGHFEYEGLKEKGCELIKRINTITYKAKLRSKLSQIAINAFRVANIRKLTSDDKMTDHVRNQLQPDIPSDDIIKLELACFSKEDVPIFVEKAKQVETFEIINIASSSRALSALIRKDQLNNLLRIDELESAFPIENNEIVEAVHSRAGAIRSNYINSLVTGLNYYGQGVVVAVREGGGVEDGDIDFRLRQYENFSIPPDGTHKTGVAGHFLGAGNENPRHIGIVPGADFYDIPNSNFSDFRDLYNNHNVRYINNSFGHGIPSAYYKNWSELRDEEMYDKNKLIFVHSAGNENAKDTTYPVGPYHQMPGNMAKISSYEKTCKNNIVCQSVNEDDEAYTPGSNGPVYDGRIKPDITADGGLGTSHAAPKVAGALTLLNQVSKDLFGVEPENSLLKAILINSTDDHGRAKPDFRYGFGKMNVKRAYETLTAQNHFSGTLSEGDTNTFYINVPSNIYEVKVTLCWTDPAASSTPTPDTTLVNNLDLFLEKNGMLINPWVLDTDAHQDSLEKIATRGIDDLNNVEQVSFTLGVTMTGGPYSINVVGKSLDVLNPNQSYNIAYELIPKKLELLYPLGGEKFGPGEDERIRWDSYGYNGDFIIQYMDMDSLVWKPIASVSNSKRTYNWTIDSTTSFFFKNFKIRVKETIEGVESTSEPFTVSQVPKGFHYVGSCNGKNYFNWGSLSGVDYYHIHKMDGKYMSEIDIDFSSNVAGVDNTTKYYSVSAIKDGVEGRRSNSYFIDSSYTNCNYEPHVNIIPNNSPPINNCSGFDENIIAGKLEQPYDLSSADIDGDGDIDFFSASYEDDKLSWHENDGNEAFIIHIINDDADGANSVHAVDLDGDSDIDLLSTTELDGKVSWYENDGNQNFTKKDIKISAALPSDAYAVDLDNDSDIDIISSIFSDNSIAWYENNGNQIFTEHVVDDSAFFATSVFAQDINSDGYIDILSTTSGDNTVCWYENDGASGFTKRIINSSAFNAQSVYAIDINGDGNMDVLSASSGDDKIVWYENDGSENFTPNTIVSNADGANSVYALDIDNDNDIDIVSSSANDNRVSWYENNGSQSFLPHSIDTENEQPGKVLALDLNGDSLIDIMSASRGDGRITWYKNDGSENFTSNTLSCKAYGANSVHSADINNDGILDVVSASRDGNEIVWYENSGNQTFKTHFISDSATNVHSVFAVDINGDSYIDIVSALASENKIVWYQNDGSENFTEKGISNTTAFPNSVISIDLDADGDMDVLSSSAMDNKIAWHENINNIFTTHIITTNAIEARSVYCSDIDSDGDLDVMSASGYDDKIAWYENDGSQSFTSHIISESINGARSVHSVDLDGDGDMDVISASLRDNNIAWHENDGSQNFSSHVISNEIGAAWSVYSGDIDKDGDIDIISATSQDDKISWFENDGNQVFTHKVISDKADNARNVFAIDIDADGDLDILSASLGDNKIAWYENKLKRTQDSISICESDSLLIGGSYKNIQGVYLDTLPSSLGCDSIVEVTLSINPLFVDSINATICDGESYIFGSQTLSTAGNYTEIYSSINSCDSIIELNLNVITSTISLSITGLDSVLVNNTASYKLNGGDSIVWSIIGGHIINGFGTDSINVLWDTIGVKLLTAEVYDNWGCIIDTIHYNVEVYDVPTRIDQYIQNGLRVYPNPFSHFAYLEFSNERMESFELIIYDVLNNRVRITENINKNKIVINRGNLKKGVYVLHLISGSKSYLAKLVVD